jgi:hypothetical protein
METFLNHTKMNIHTINLIVEKNEMDSEISVI